MIFCLSPGNYHDAPEERKLIESIYSKNNAYLLIDRAYENDKALALAENHGFKTLVPPKKIVSSFEAMINSFINSATISKDIS